MELPSCLNTFPTRGMFSANAGFVIHTVENTAAAAVSPKAVLYTVLNFLCDFAVPVDFFPELPVDFSVDFSGRLCTIFSAFSTFSEAASMRQPVCQFYEIGHEITESRHKFDVIADNPVTIP